MSLQQLYLRFLAAPTEASLNPDAGFHYITTGISLSTPKAITDFLVKEQKILKQKSNKVLSSIQAGQTLVLEVETVLEFVTGAGHYLPGLDSNFVSDHTVVFPLVSIPVLFGVDVNAFTRAQLTRGRLGAFRQL